MRSSWLGASRNFMTARGTLMTGAIAVAACAAVLDHPVTAANARTAAGPMVPQSPPPRLVAGYLKPGTGPDSLVIVPPPPVPGSAAQERDLAASKDGLALRGSARWALATRDADLFSPGSAGTFSCAAGIAIGPAETPKLNQLLRRAGTDLALSTSATKRKYMRPRPFTQNGQPICTPADETLLRGDGSYPSGHSAIGYGWSLILAEVLPDRAAQLVARGRAFGDSRRVCNVHWLSDVEEGRIMGAAMVARLHADATFLADIDAAKAEARSVVAAAKGPGRDCASEAAALGL